MFVDITSKTFYYVMVIFNVKKSFVFKSFLVSDPLLKRQLK